MTLHYIFVYIIYPSEIYKIRNIYSEILFYFFHYTKRIDNTVTFPAKSTPAPQPGTTPRTRRFKIMHCRSYKPIAIRHLMYPRKNPGVAPLGRATIVTCR